MRNPLLVKERNREHVCRSISWARRVEVRLRITFRSRGLALGKNREIGFRLFRTQETS